MARAPSRARQAPSTPHPAPGNPSDDPGCDIPPTPAPHAQHSGPPHRPSEDPARRRTSHVTSIGPCASRHATMHATTASNPITPMTASITTCTACEPACLSMGGGGGRKEGGGLCPLDPHQGATPWTVYFGRQGGGTAALVAPHNWVMPPPCLPIKKVWGVAPQRGPGAEPLASLPSTVPCRAEQSPLAARAWEVPGVFEAALLGGGSPFLADLARREAATLEAIVGQGPDAVCACGVGGFGAIVAWDSAGGDCRGVAHGQAARGFGDGVGRYRRLVGFGASNGGFVGFGRQCFAHCCFAFAAGGSLAGGAAFAASGRRRRAGRGLRCWRWASSVRGS